MWQARFPNRTGIKEMKTEYNNMEYNELEKQWSRLLNKFSQRYVIPGYDQEDIMQELRMTLVRANELHDPKKSKFITYLYSALNSKCKQLYRDVQGRQKHIPYKCHSQFLHYIFLVISRNNISL